MAVPLSSAAFPDVLDPRFMEIMDGLYETDSDLFEQLYTQRSSTLEVERGSAITPMGNFQQFSGTGGTGTVPYDGPDQGYDWNATHIEWALGIQIQRRLWTFDQFDIIDGRMENLRDSAFETRQTHAARVLNNAFSVDTFFSTHTEGVALCSNSHTSPRSGVSTASGFDNYVTSELSPTALSAARTQMRLLRDDAGRRRGPMADTLVIPVDLEDRALEIINTSKGLDTNEGNINPQEGRYRIITSRYLTDANNYFLCNYAMMKKNLMLFEADELEFARVEDFDTIIAKFRGYMTYTIARKDWRWVIGAEVS